jgi:diaminopropionate ammonia-lyase
LDSDLGHVAAAARKANITLFAATEGNHGRAVARMGKLLGLPTRIFMSGYADDETVQKIESEGAEVTVISGDYDEAVAAAHKQSQTTPHGILVQDNSFAGYSQQIPGWIVEGYSTLLQEVEQDLHHKNLTVTTLVTPIGVGSLGHAVVAHCKSRDPPVVVLTVEPETAACLHDNLKAGQWKTIPTSATIMNGMNCGTVSPISWPVFVRGVDASVTVSDHECHAAVQYLQSHGVDAGPCGAATLAGLRKLARARQKQEDDVVVASLLGEDAVIVLLSTEGSRGYPIPHDGSPQTS